MLLLVWIEKHGKSVIVDDVKNTIFCFTPFFLKIIKAEEDEGIEIPLEKKG